MIQISSKGFWDVDFEKLIQEHENYSDFIIKRIINYGTFNDIIAIIKFYGKQKVTETLINLHYLPPKKLHFASKLLNVEKSKFKCYIKKPQAPFYTKR